jgi:hypothetical protein
LRDAVQAIGHNRAQHHEPIYREEVRGVAYDRGLERGNVRPALSEMQA